MSSAWICCAFRREPEVREALRDEISVEGAAVLDRSGAKSTT